jgi:uncharacterized membrane protein
MQGAKHTINDRDIEKTMSNLLRYGVLASALIVTTGAFFYLSKHGNEIPRYKQFIGEPKRFIELKEIFITVLQGKGRSIIQLGALVLIATPIARIIFSIVGYILQRDYLYIIITMIVFLVILYGLF